MCIVASCCLAMVSTIREARGLVAAATVVEVPLPELGTLEVVVVVLAAETRVRRGIKVGLKLKAVRGDELVDAAMWCCCSFCSVRYCDIAEGDMNCNGREVIKGDSCAVALPDIGRFLGRNLLL